MLLDLKASGLKNNPKLAVGGGAPSFWKALPKVFGPNRGQYRWARRLANILNKLPRRLHPKAKASLQEIWMAASREPHPVWRVLYIP